MSSIPSVYPFVNRINLDVGFAKGGWDFGKPYGITVHYSADRDLHRVITWLSQQKLGYHLIIDREGLISQTCYFDKRVDHAGSAKWNNLSPNKHHISICLLSWGKLIKTDNKYYDWTGKEIPFQDVAERPDLRGDSGCWDKATNKQESSLKSVLSWFITMGIKPDNICGHNEACIPEGRKQDPGGVLSFTMCSLRQSLTIRE